MVRVVVGQALQEQHVDVPVARYVALQHDAVRQTLERFACVRSLQARQIQRGSQRMVAGMLCVPGHDDRAFFHLWYPSISEIRFGLLRNGHGAYALYMLVFVFNGRYVLRFHVDHVWMPSPHVFAARDDFHSFMHHYNDSAWKHAYCEIKDMHTGCPEIDLYFGPYKYLLDCSVSKECMQPHQERMGMGSLFRPHAQHKGSTYKSLTDAVGKAREQP
jgi:hypothetical protein